MSLSHIFSLAWLLRIAVALGISAVLLLRNGTAIWLDDEASYHLASLALLPLPVAQTLPLGLEHLGGSAYLGLTSYVYALFGAQPILLRLVNATIGAMVACMAATLASRLYSPSAGKLAGIAVACWPPLILWSVTILRDALVSFCVVAIWLILLAPRTTRLARTTHVALIALALLLLASLRWYVYVAAGAGVAAWAFLRLTRRVQVALVVVVALSLGVVGPRVVDRLDSRIQEIAFRQAASRMEALGKLYVRDPEPGLWGRGAMVVYQAPGEAPLPGVIREHVNPEVERIAFVDRSERAVPRSTLTPFRLVTFNAPYVLANVLPNVSVVLLGYTDAARFSASSAVWVLDALAWLAFLLLAIRGIARQRPALRQWVYPLVVATVTIVALVAVPGAPGNAARHREAQTVPLLLALAAGALLPAASPRGRESASTAAVPTKSGSAAIVAMSSRSR